MNRDTYRHAIAAGLVEEPAPAEQQPPADDDWIPWAGGECPCPDWPEVEYECHNGYKGICSPSGLSWRHIGKNSDIIAYRRPPPCPTFEVTDAD